MIAQVIRCSYCRRRPADLPAIAELAAELEVSPDDYIRAEEGTFNRETGGFACDECYIAIGMPTSPTGWKAP